MGRIRSLRVAAMVGVLTGRGRPDGSRSGGGDLKPVAFHGSPLHDPVVLVDRGETMAAIAVMIEKPTAADR